MEQKLVMETDKNSTLIAKNKECWNGLGIAARKSMFKSIDWLFLILLYV